MATDRIVYWEYRRPEAYQIQMALQDYIGEGLGVVQWVNEDARWRVVLNGESSHPLQRIGPNGPDLTMRRERCFEVIPCTTHLGIVTRDQSPLVQAIADGFVRFAVEHWHGRLETEA